MDLLKNIDKSLLEDGKIFFNHRSDGGGGTSNHHQLHNPAASGVIVRVLALHIANGAASTNNIGYRNTALAGTLVQNMPNLLNAGPTSAIDFRSQAGGFATDAILDFVQIQGTEVQRFDFSKYPLRLDEGQGFLVQQLASAALRTTFIWSETSQ